METKYLTYTIINVSLINNLCLIILYEIHLFIKSKNPSHCWLFKILIFKMIR